MLRTLSGTLTALLLAMHSFAIAQEQSVEKTLWSVDWNPNGTQFAVGGVETLWLFDAKTFERKSLLPLGSQDNHQADDAEFTGVTTVSWHPFQNHLAVSSQGGNVNGIYDADSGTRIPLRVDHGRGIDWGPKGDILAVTSTGDGHLRVFKSDGSLLHDTPRHKSAKGLTGVAWQPSGNKVVTIGKYITLHDANGTVSRQITHRPDASGDCLLLCVEWHPSGEFFVVGDYGNNDTADPPTIQFWSADGDLMKTIAIDEGSEFRNISWNHDGTLLASASDKLRIWTKAGELQHEGDSPDLLWGVDWHPKGHSLLTSSAEGRVTLWTADAKVSKRIVEVETAYPPNSVSKSEVETSPNEKPDSGIENGDVARTRKYAGIWKPMVLEGRELHPSLRTRQADEPVLHMRDDFVLPRNPHVSTNARFVENLSRSGSQGRISSEGIRSVLFATYGDVEKRVQIRGVEAASDLDASWREAAVRVIWAVNIRHGNIRVHRSGTLLVVVWHQGLSAESWEAVNASVAKKLSEI